MQIESTAKPATSRPIGITATYTIQSQDGTSTASSQTFDSSHSDASEARVGLPLGVEPVKVSCESSKIKFAFFSVGTKLTQLGILVLFAFQNNRRSQEMTHTAECTIRALFRR